MPFKLKYYAENNGVSPAREYVISLSESEQAKIRLRLDFFCERPMGEWPQTWYDKVESNIWELKSPPYRLLYFLHDGCLVVLHALKKARWKLHENDKATARRRRDRYVSVKDGQTRRSPQ